MPLSDIFKSKEEIEAEQKKRQKHELRDADRSCNRMKADLERQEHELEAQIKAAAKKGDQETTKALAKHLIRVREQKVRLVGAKSKISTISNQASAMQTTNKLAQVMANSAAAMSKVNQQMKPEELAKQMGQFQAENMKMEMGESAMNDMFEELFEEEDAEADEVMNQVLSEIGIDTSIALSSIPATSKDGVHLAQKGAASTSSKAAPTKAPHNH